MGLFLEHMHAAAAAIPGTARVRDRLLQYGILRAVREHTQACDTVQPAVDRVMQHLDIYTTDIWLPILNIRGGWGTACVSAYSYCSCLCYCSLLQYHPQPLLRARVPGAVPAVTDFHCRHPALSHPRCLQPSYPPGILDLDAVPRASRLQSPQALYAASFGVTARDTVLWVHPV